MSSIHIDPVYAQEMANYGIVPRPPESPQVEILVTIEDDQMLREKLAAIQILVIRAKQHKVEYVPVRLLEMVFELDTK